MYICFFSTRLRFSFSHRPAPRSPPLLHRTPRPTPTTRPNSLVPAPHVYFSHKMQAQTQNLENFFGHFERTLYFCTR